MEESGVRLVVENAGSYFSALAKATDATNDLNQASQKAADGVDDLGQAANKVKLQQLNNQLADQKNRLTALSAELEKQGNAYDFTSKKALSTAAAYQRVEKQAQLTQAKIALLNQKMNQGDGGKPAIGKVELPDLKTDQQESAIKGLIGTIGGLAGAYVSLGAVAQFAFEGLTLGAELEQSKFAIQTLTGSVEKGNAIYDEAIKFGQKYGYTQQEMASAAAQAASIFNKTNQSTEKTLEVLGRLAALNPAEGFEGAVIAFKELASGDITSIAERFNIARGEANAMKDAIAAGADPVKVLDDALAKMNVTSDVLSNRMKGTNGALLDVKLAFEDSKLAVGEFMTAIGAPEMLENFARGLKYVSDGLRNFTLQLAKAGGQGEFNVQTGITDATNYQEYVAAAKVLQVENEKAKQSFLGIPGAATNAWTGIRNLASGYDTTAASSRILTDQEWQLRQAFLDQGLSADQASSAATNLIMTQKGLAVSTSMQIQAQGLNAEEQDRLNQSTATLQQSIMTLAMTHPELISQIQNTVVQTMLQGGSTDELILQIETLTTTTELQIDVQSALVDAHAAVTEASDTTTAAVYELTDAEYKSAEAKLNSALESEQAAQFEQDLAIAYDMAAQGAVGQVAAISYLMNAYGLEAKEVSRLINLLNELNKARAGKLGNAAAGALAGTITQMEGIQAGRITAPYTGGGRKSGGGGKGKKAGKSEEQKQAEKNEKALAKIEDRIIDAHEKYLAKKEQLDRDHVDRLAKIEADYQKKSLEAEKKFNSDKFNVRNSFKGSILDLDKDLWDAARAEEVGYWNESQAIAQAGDAKRAEAFYQAAQEYTAMKAEHAQELRDLDAQIAGSTDEQEQADLAERKRRLEEYYTEQELLAKENLDKLRNGENELATERDQAISEENARYTEANNELEQNFRDTVTELIQDSDDLQNAVVDMVSALIPSFASLAQAARDAANTAGSIPDTSADKSIMPVESRAGGGNVQRNRAYLVGDKPGGKPTPWSEVFVPKQSGTIMPRQATQAMLESRPRALPATPQQQMQRQQTQAIANYTTEHYNLTVQTNQSPRVVQQSFAQMEALSK